MKNTSNTYRGAGHSLVITLLIAFACLWGANSACAANVINQQGSYAIDGSTNTVLVAGTNVQVSVIPTLGTNTFNMPGGANTNLWPALPLFNVKNTIPIDKLWLFMQWNQMGLNGGSNIIVRIASSADNSHWVSNAIIYTIGTNSFVSTSALNVSAMLFTNNTPPFLALQALENPGQSTVSNLFLVPVAKPNL